MPSNALPLYLKPAFVAVVWFTRCSPRRIPVDETVLWDRMDDRYGRLEHVAGPGFGPGWAICNPCIPGISHRDY